MSATPTRAKQVRPILETLLRIERTIGGSSPSTEEVREMEGADVDFARLGTIAFIEETIATGIHAESLENVKRNKDPVVREREIAAVHDEVVNYQDNRIRGTYKSQVLLALDRLTVNSNVDAATRAELRAIKTVSGPWDAAEFLTQQFPVPAAAEPTCVFKRPGEHWLVKFFDEMDATMVHSRGMHYIVALLAVPNKWVSAMTLTNTEENAARPAEQVSGSGNLTPAATKILTELQEEQEQLVECRTNNDLGGIRLHQDRVNCLRQRFEAVNTGQSEAKNAATNVRQGIDKAIGRIGRKMPNLAQHLKLIRRDNNGFTYQTDGITLPPWDL